MNPYAQAKANGWRIRVEGAPGRFAWHAVKRADRGRGEALYSMSGHTRKYLDAQREAVRFAVHYDQTGEDRTKKRDEE